MIEPIIKATNVSKVLGSGATQVRALKDVNISLSGSQLAVLMGPSGSGKTAPLSILGCMLRAYSENSTGLRYLSERGASGRACEDPPRPYKNSRE
jgi:ABC-type lipoprotein export system ATPase subunit